MTFDPLAFELVPVDQLPIPMTHKMLDDAVDAISRLRRTHEIDDDTRRRLDDMCDELRALRSLTDVTGSRPKRRRST